MGIWSNIKNIMSIPEDDEYDEEQYAAEESVEEEAPRKERAEAPRIIRSRASQRNNASTPNSMQVFLARPERFEDVTEIADNLNAGKTAILNLEDANHDVSRRIVDFLSGVAYANGGNMKKVAKNTFVIVARGVDISGNFPFEEMGDRYM